jgi:hypothetical protein
MYNGDFSNAVSKRGTQPMSGNINPYAAPQSESMAGQGSPGQPYQTIFAWERLRLAYNGLLLAAIMLGYVGRRQHNPDPTDFAGSVVLGLLGANVCYCAGPVLEAYLASWGADSKLARWLLFIVGAGFSVLISGVATVATPGL